MPPFTTQSSLYIGSHHVDNPVVLAPMSGVTDIVLRRLAVRYGVGLAVSEMVASGELAAGDDESRLRAEGEGMPLHVVQLAARDPHWIAEGARVAEASGARIIDINMGCPAKKVTGGSCGAALLRDLDLALRLIDATVAAVSVPVTVKMRLGWDEHSIVAPELARRAQEAGAQLITVHGRTRQQFYNGVADWPAIRAVTDAISIPLIANGDVTQLDDAPRILKQSGASGVMIGRGAQGRPWFPGAVAHFLATGERLPEPNLEEQRAVALEHYEGLLSLYGVDVGARHARKHLGWYMDSASEYAGAPLAPEIRTNVLTAPTPAAAMAALDEAYDRLGWRAAA